MSELADLEPIPAQGHHFGPGEVLHGPLDGLFRVRLTVDGAPRESWARAAVTSPVSIGDEVLVAGESMERLFVIGVLTHGRQAPKDEVRTDAGACARVEEQDGQQRLRVFSEQDELLFEYNPAAGKATVIKGRGDLAFEAQDGDISMRSTRGIRLEAQEIDLAAGGGIRLAVGDELRRLGSTLWLGVSSLRAASARVAFDAQRARLNIDETRFIGRRVLAKLAYVQLVADKCETVANTVVERSRNAYRTVEQLSQVKAGRLRTLVENTYQMTVGKAFLKSREDFKVKADKIHLG